jgi:hypothetical protein
MKRFLAVLVTITTGMATLLAVAPDDALAQTPAVATVASTPGGFVSLVSTRLLDTRSGNGAAQAAVDGGHTVAVQVTGRGGVPSSGVSAVVLNVTVVAPARAGFVTVFGGGAARPSVSNLNFVAGQVVPNLVVAPVGADGTVDLYNGSTGSVQLLADVSGWFRSGPPGPVTEVSATAGNTSVELRWVNPGDSSLTGVMIRRSVGYTPPASASAGTLVADVAKPTAVFTDTGLVSNTQYSYALFAHDAAPAFAPGATVTATTTATTTGPPGPVTGVTATAGKTSVELRWENPVDSSLTGVMIRRAVGAVAPASASAGTLVADVAKPTVVFTDSGLSSKTQYSYALFAHDAAPSYAAAAAVTVSTTDGAVPSIAGTVTDAGGTHHGLEAVGVNVVSISTGNGVSTSTLSDGTWSVIGLAAGRYSVCFDGSDAVGGSSDTFGYVDQCYQNQPTVNTATPVTVIAGATTTGVNAALAGASH